MAKGCVGIWAGKIEVDYCRYLQGAIDKLSMRLADTQKLLKR